MASSFVEGWIYMQAEFEGETLEKYGEWREAWGCMKVGDVRSVSLNNRHPDQAALRLLVVFSVSTPKTRNPSVYMKFQIHS